MLLPRELKAIGIYSSEVCTIASLTSFDITTNHLSRQKLTPCGISLLKWIANDKELRRNLNVHRLSQK